VNAKLVLMLVSAIALVVICRPSRAVTETQTGHITGIVKDASNATIRSAQVMLVIAPQSVLATTETDSRGEFHFNDVLPGSYAVIVTHSGFSMARRPVIVRSGQISEAGVTLGINPLAEQLTVSAETGRAEDRSTLPQQVNIIADDSLRARASAVLAQVATEESGISLQRTSPTIGAILVRGLTEVGVYVDGIRYTNSTQRSGINTFFNLNDPANIQAVEVLRGPNSAQYGSDSLGGLTHLISRQPGFSTGGWNVHGELNTFYNSSDNSFGSNASASFAGERFGLLVNASGRRVNTLRPAQGIDDHAAVTRFLGLPSNILGERMSDTAFSQYGGALHLNYSLARDQTVSLRYQRSQQDGGKRYDQLLGGDGNLIADLRNLMLDFGYLRYAKQKLGPLDNLSMAVSYSSQREERVNQGGQGNPKAEIIHDWERTSSHGFNFYLDRQLPRRNSFSFGGDLYHDHVYSSSYSSDPVAGTVTPVRPRVPGGARYILAGVYMQDTCEILPGRLRFSGALRYNVASYRSKAANSPLVKGQPLFPDDSLRVSDTSGRLGAVLTVAGGLNVAFNYSRGFRAPNVTNLGSLGLVGVGFQVSAADIQGMGAMIGTTADDGATSSGVTVKVLESEVSNNYDLSLRFQRGRVRMEAVGFIIDYGNTIVRQTLILPQGAVGKLIGSSVIESQNANGAVYVSLSPSPVLVQANYGATRLKGFEYSVSADIGRSWKLAGNYSYVHAADKYTGLPPNLGGGGMPPQTGFLRLRYQPLARPFWVEGYSTLAGRQERLSSLDLADRRTGAARSRGSVQNFFRRGATLRGLVGPGPDGSLGNADDRLLLTGETLAQVQTRVLGTASSAPLFPAIPGYAIFGLRGGYRFGEGNRDVLVDFANIADKGYRAPGWGMEGSGRSLRLSYQWRF
jgi:hemoglobin/transferrin/lactoferrin receptor protein